MSMTVQKIREKVTQIILRKYGRVDEKLMSSGLIDSMGAVQLAMALENEFSLPIDTFQLSDMATIEALIIRIEINIGQEGVT